MGSARTLTPPKCLLQLCPGTPSPVPRGQSSCAPTVLSQVCPGAAQSPGAPSWVPPGPCQARRGVLIALRKEPRLCSPVSLRVSNLGIISTLVRTGVHERGQSQTPGAGCLPTLSPCDNAHPDNRRTHPNKTCTPTTDAHVTQQTYAPQQDTCTPRTDAVHPNNSVHSNRCSAPQQNARTPTTDTVHPNRLSAPQQTHAP